LTGKDGFGQGRADRQYVGEAGGSGRPPAGTEDYLARESREH
jgi:hypothetical protein